MSPKEETQLARHVACSACGVEAGQPCVPIDEAQARTFSGDSSHFARCESVGIDMWEDVTITVVGEVTGEVSHGA